MHLLIDESKNFIFQEDPLKSWKIATICGAILPYKNRKTWLAKYKKLEKASNLGKKEESKICQILDDMIKYKIRGVLLVGDIGYTSKADAELLRLELITPLYSFAAKEPDQRGKALKKHLDNLLGKGDFKFSLQDFYKTWSILEIITMFLQWLTGNLNKIRAIDLRKLLLIIDDQAKASLKTFTEFIHFFLWCRSGEGLFSCPPESLTRLNSHLRIEGGSKFINTTSLFKKILVEEHGSKMDDKYSELKIADFLSGISRKTLNGELSFEVARKLNKILDMKSNFQASLMEELIVQVPPEAEKSVNLLIK